MKLKMLLHWLSDTKAELLIGQATSIPPRTSINLKFDLLAAIKARQSNPPDADSTEQIEVECDLRCVDCGFSSDDQAVYETHRRETHGY